MIIGAYVAVELWVTGGEAARGMNKWRECIAVLERGFLSMPALSVEHLEPDLYSTFRESRSLGALRDIRSSPT